MGVERVEKTSSKISPTDGEYDRQEDWKISPRFYSKLCRAKKSIYINRCSCTKSMLLKIEETWTLETDHYQQLFFPSFLCYQWKNKIRIILVSVEFILVFGIENTFTQYARRAHHIFKIASVLSSPQQQTWSLFLFD